MDYGIEGWIRFYRYESPDEKIQPLFARGLRDYLNRIVRQDTGILVQNCRSLEHAVETLVLACQAHESERQLAIQYVFLWIQVGDLVVHDRRGKVSIEIKDFYKKQTAAPSRGAARMRKHRAKKLLAGAQLPLSMAPPTIPSAGSYSRPSPVTSPTSPSPSPVTSLVTTKKERKKEIQKERNTSDVTPLPGGIQIWAKAYLDDPETVAHQLGDPATWWEVTYLLSQFNEVWDKEHEILDGSDARAQVILERYSEGHSVEKLGAAIRGARGSEWIREHGTMQTLTTILKDAHAVDKYAAMDGAHAGNGHGNGQGRTRTDYECEGWTAEARPNLTPDVEDDVR